MKEADTLREVAIGIDQVPRLIDRAECVLNVIAQHAAQWHDGVEVARLIVQRRRGVSATGEPWRATESTLVMRPSTS